MTRLDNNNNRVCKSFNRQDYYYYYYTTVLLTHEGTSVSCTNVDLNTAYTFHYCPSTSVMRAGKSMRGALVCRWLIDRGL